MVTAKKGFTLIELLIVIGILAILATAAILVLNPARLFQEARDSQRISDLTAIKNAVELYLATAATPSLGGATCGADWWATRSAVVAGSQPFATPAITEASATWAVLSDSLKTNGTGWVRVNLDSLSDGSPLAALPRDPRNSDGAALTSTGMFYAYQCTPDTGANALKYELNARMESVRYANGGDDDVESRDGGNNNDIYEVGNDPGLNL
jgi:prepilin-type N-terminal cleavage/methylation domain-containing protein